MRESPRRSGVSGLAPALCDCAGAWRCQSRHTEISLIPAVMITEPGRSQITPHHEAVAFDH